MKNNILVTLMIVVLTSTVFFKVNAEGSESGCSYYDNKVKNYVYKAKITKSKTTNKLYMMLAEKYAKQYDECMLTEKYNKINAIKMQYKGSRRVK